MKSFIEEMKDIRMMYDFGGYTHEMAVNVALGFAQHYFGLKHWTEGYEQIVRSYIPAYSRKCIKEVQRKGYDTDTYTTKVFFELCR